jgi:predicted nucleotide-binding protein
VLQELDLERLMAKRPTPQPQPAALTDEQMRKGIATLVRRISDVEKFDPKTAAAESVTALEHALDEAIERVFGKGTSDYNRYISAAALDKGPVTFFGPARARDTCRYLMEGKAHALATLRQAAKALEERVEESTPIMGGHTATSSDTDNKSVFIVHGHDGEIKHDVARFLNTLGLTPVILSEQANRGMTIIEKFEEHSKVGFAVVLLTPDDVGALKGQPNRPRARQNVVLELGFFVGKLGRKRVTALVRGQDIELPSDIAGLVWTRYEDDWKFNIARELKVAGYEIDMNKAVG